MGESVVGNIFMLIIVHTVYIGFVLPKKTNLA